MLKKDNIYEKIAKDAETRLDNSNYEIVRALPKGRNEKNIGLINDELSEKIMTKFVKIRTKTWYYYNLVKQMMAVKIKNKRHSKMCHKKKLKI